jgi:hypothetical protein
MRIWLTWGLRYGAGEAQFERGRKRQLGRFRLG